MGRRRRATIRRPTPGAEGAEGRQLDVLMDTLPRVEPSVGGCSCSCARCEIGNHCGEVERGCMHYYDGSKGGGGGDGAEA
jgi:hypothetical protein